MPLLPHILSSFQQSTVALTQDSNDFQQHYSRKKIELKVICQWLCSQIFYWAYHEETSGLHGYTSNQGSVPPNTTGCISSGNTAMAAPSMERVKVSHSHGKSYVLISKMPKSHSNNSLQSWNCCGRSERALRIFPSWLKVTALLPMVPRQQQASCQRTTVKRESFTVNFESKIKTPSRPDLVLIWESKPFVVARPFWHGWKSWCQYNTR